MHDPHPSAAQAWVLIVDDDESLRHLLPRVLRRLLGDDALHVETAATPEAALHAVQARCDAPLVVLSDFDLKASVDGIELLRLVEERCPSARRVLYSGHPRELLQRRLATTTAIHAFHEKPDRLADLAPPIMEHIREARLQAEA